MAIGGAFLGGGVEVVPAGSCKLELEILTEDRANLTATFTIKGTSTYTVTAGADGRAVYTVPAGQTYTVSVNTTGYDNLASQTVIAESGTVRYVRFEAFSGRVKRSGDTMTGTLAVVGGASIDTNGQVIGKKLRTTADIHLGSSPSSYAVINDGWIQNRTIDETKSDLGITSKQDKLTAGENITIDGTTISAKDTTYDVATQSANGLMSSVDKTKLDGVDSALAGKVSKSGDTMTGILLSHTDSVTPIIIKNKNMDVNETGGPESQITFNDKNNVLVGRVGVSNYGFKSIGISSFWNDTWYDFALRKDADGSVYGIAPSWSVGTNDNSDKILTIKMANSLPSLVHTTGNESIAGNKSFSGMLVSTNSINFKGSVDNPDVIFRRSGTNGVNMSVFIENTSYPALTISTSGKSVAIGSNTVQAYTGTTPSGATENEIATANWALSKFQRKITYGTGDPPSGGQAGDIYIKI